MTLQVREIEVRRYQLRAPGFFFEARSGKPEARERSERLAHGWHFRLERSTCAASRFRLRASSSKLGARSSERQSARLARGLPRREVRLHQDVEVRQKNAGCAPIAGPGRGV